MIETNKKGCFLRLARNVEGRVTLKELCDGFLPNPAISFPPGRLVVGKVKEVRDTPKKYKNASSVVKFQVDLDMRESTLLDQTKKLAYDDIKLNSKYKGTITRVESYGVFVQIENSNISGLAHMSECSDSFIKNLGALYDPGDLVKLLVIKKDDENRKLGFSLKSSHFEDDEDSDEDSSVDLSDDEEMIDNADMLCENGSDDSLDSDDENFGAKLASRLHEDQDESSDEEDEVKGSRKRNQSVSSAENNVKRSASKSINHSTVSLNEFEASYVKQNPRTSNKTNQIPSNPTTYVTKQPLVDVGKWVWSACDFRFVFIGVLVGMVTFIMIGEGSGKGIMFNHMIVM